VADAVAVAVLWLHAVVAATLVHRHVSFKKWRSFCEDRGLNPIRRDGATVCSLKRAKAFIADVTITQRLQGDTVTQYLQQGS
jgi:hypothetical protein